MKEAEVRFGVVGLGVGMGHCQSICDLDGMRLVAVSDLSEKRGKEATERYRVPWYQNYQNLIERDDIDVVMICTPTHLHMDIAVEAAKAGKHLLVEKPIERTLERADKIISVCQEAGVKLAVNFQNRYLSDNVKTKRAIDAGKIGKLLLGTVSLREYRSQDAYDQAPWRKVPGEGGGGIMDVAIHDIDLLQWFMGRVETIFAETAVLAHDMKADDLGVAVVTFKNGALGTIVGTTALHRKFGPRIEIHGTRGAIVTEKNHITMLELEGGDDVDTGGVCSNTFDDLVDAIRTDREPIVNGEEARKTLEIVVALYESAKTRSLVRL